MDSENLHKHYFACFGLLLLNEWEQRFSQPKLELYGLFHALHAYKIFLIGICNLIVKVDARYIHGMLNNPDTTPSTSLNRWIVSILMFHFELQHIPGKQHGPDGLSQQPPQPGNISNKEDLEDFDNWVDNLYRFMHLLNPPTPEAGSAKLLCAFVQEQTVQCPTNIMDSNREDNPLEYQQVPHMETAVQANKWLEMVHDWLNSFERPNDITDHEYVLVICYTTGFFLDNNTLWKCDPQGAHKQVLYVEQQVDAMVAAHNASAKPSFGHSRS